LEGDRVPLLKGHGQALEHYYNNNYYYYYLLICVIHCCKVLVVDIDGGRLLHSYGDEQHIIPRKLQKALVSSVKDDSGNVVPAELMAAVVEWW